MSKVFKSVLGGVASIFGGGAKPPAPPPPTPMPDSQSPAALAARRKAMAKQMGSTGRESTMLSSGATGVFGSETLG
jgi:hypothetical protein